MIEIMLALAVASAAVTARAEACPAIPADTLVQIEVVDRIESRTAKIGDRFAIRLAAPLVLDGITALPAGTPGVGEVVHAQRHKLLPNRPGELLVTARYFNLGGQRLPLRAFSIARVGPVDVYRTYAGNVPVARNTTIEPGTKATAKVAGNCVTDDTTALQEAPK